MIAQRQAEKTLTAPQETRRLQAVPSAQPDTFTKVPDSLWKTRTGLSQGPKDLLARLIRYNGNRDDATPITVKQKQLEAALASSRDRIIAWTKELRQPHPCWRGADHEHPFIRTKQRGKKLSNVYEIVQCADAEERGEATPIRPREKRAKTGGRTKAVAAAPSHTTLFDDRPTPDALTGEFEKTNITRPPAPGFGDTPPPSDRRALRRQILTLEALYNGYTIPEPVIAFLTDQEIDSPEAVLRAVVALASVLKKPISVELARHVVERSGELENVNITTATPESDLVNAALALARKREPHAVRLYAAEFVQKALTMIAERAEDEADANATLRRILCERRVRVSDKPYTFVYTGLTEGWLYTPETEDRSDEDLRKAFEKLPAEAQREIERHYRMHYADRVAIDPAFLAERGVKSRRMLNYCARRFSL